MAKRSKLTLHDKFFKTSMEDVRIAKDFFKAHLPADLQQKVNWDSLKLEPGSFIDENYTSAYTDVLYQVDISGKAGFIYILSEHQSRPDRFMPLRLWSYMCRIWDSYIKKSPGKVKQLPIIYPITLYHGKQKPYPYSMDFFELFPDKALARQLLLEEPFPLIDLTLLSDEELKQHGYVAAMELLQKHIFYSDILGVFKSLVGKGILRLIADLDSGRYVLKLITYAVEKGEVSSIDELTELLKQALPEKEENIMTGAEQLRQQGMQQGIQQGMQQGIQKGKLETAKRMLEMGFEVSVVAKSTGLSEMELDALLEEG